MDPRAKRRIRLVVSLGAAVLLAVALIYTSFGASSQAVTPASVVDAPADGRSYQLTGKVMPGYRREGDVLHFRVRERAGRVSVPVSYSGVVPDPFRAGREVIVTVKRERSGFVAEHDSLITKCPSKFSSESEAS
jgi:cytochrome c-type biogenesis protein CcmE